MGKKIVLLLRLISLVAYLLYIWTFLFFGFRKQLGHETALLYTLLFAYCIASLSCRRNLSKGMLSLYFATLAVVPALAIYTVVVALGEITSAEIPASYVAMYVYLILIPNGIVFALSYLVVWLIAFFLEEGVLRK